MEPLSQDEQRLYRWLSDFIHIHQYSPSIQDMQDAMEQKSRSKVQDLLKSLREKSYITWQENQPRTIQILSGKVRVVGTIQ